MANNRLAISGAALLILAGLAAWKMSARYAEDTTELEAGIKLPKVDKTKVTSLEITSPGNPTVLLTKDGETWTMTQPLASAVDMSTIDAALAKLDELEAAGTAATRKENHARLEVDDAQGVRVIAKAGDKTLCDLMIGKYSNGNTMVREHSSEKVATARGSIRYAFAKEVSDWRDKEILSFDMKSVSDIAFASAKGTFKFMRDGDTWKVAADSAPVPELDPEKVQSLVSSLSNLRAPFFAAPEVTPEQAGLAPNAAGTITVNLSGDAGPQQKVVRVGSALNGKLHIQAEGKPVIFTVLDSASDRFLPDAAYFKADPPPPPAPAAPSGGMPGLSNLQVQGLPEGMQLPPEVLQQIQQQAAAQAAGH